MLVVDWFKFSLTYSAIPETEYASESMHSVPDLCSFS